MQESISKMASRLSRVRRVVEPGRTDIRQGTKFECSTCGKVYDSQVGLRVHKTKSKKTHDLDPDTNDDCVSCQICNDDVYSHRACLPGHILLHCITRSTKYLNQVERRMEYLISKVKEMVNESFNTGAEKALDIKTVEQLIAGQVKGKVYIDMRAASNLPTVWRDFMRIFYRDGSSISQQLADDLLSWGSEHGDQLSVLPSYPEDKSVDQPAKIWTVQYYERN